METKLEIVHVEALGEDIEELADLLRGDFREVRTTETFIIAGDGIGFNPATLQFIVEQVVPNVLADFIMKSGAKLWEFISRAAKKGKRGVADDEWPPALAITVKRAEGEVQFSMWPALPPEAMREVLRAIPQLLEGVPQEKYVEFRFGPVTRTWSEPHELPEHDVEILRRQAKESKRRRRRRK